MKFVKHILICLLTVLLFYISWAPNSMAGFMFIGFTPILHLIFSYDSNTRKFSNLYLITLLFFTFLFVNFSLTSWVIHAHLFGGIFASVFNASLMTFVCFLIYKIKCKLGYKHALMAFPILWIAFEYLHLNWDLTWPWMSLGNVFSEFPNWIQWYEFTGILGGSLWVLLVNILLFFTFNQLIKNQKFINPIFFSLFFLTTPFIISKKTIVDTNYTQGKKVNIVVVQPNYEPHAEKFNKPQTTQLKEVEELIKPIWNSNPAIIVFPETFLVDWIWESRLETATGVLKMKSWLADHPNTQILTGASTGRVLNKSEYSKTTARRSRNGTMFEVFNSALLISENKPTQVFHKSKLVPGAEMTPFAQILKPVFEKFPIKLGGSIGNFGTNDTLKNFRSFMGEFTPIICYESVFGEYLSSFNSLGMEWICIITNDGWWGDTFGHQQHHSYARLRAIENRKYIVRSANTGISSVINPLGTVEQFLPYGESGVIETTITKSKTHTFYSKHGDYIGRLASFLAIVYLLQLVLTYLKNDTLDLKSLKK